MFTQLQKVPGPGLGYFTECSQSGLWHSPKLELQFLWKTEPELACQTKWTRGKAHDGMAREPLMVGLGDWFRANPTFFPINSGFQLRILRSSCCFWLWHLLFNLYTLNNKLIIAVKVLNLACFSVDSADHEEWVKVLPMFFSHCHFSSASFWTKIIFSYSAVTSSHCVIILKVTCYIKLI